MRIRTIAALKGQNHRSQELEEFGCERSGVSQLDKDPKIGHKRERVSRSVKATLKMNI